MLSNYACCHDALPSNFYEAWSITWNLKLQFLSRDGYSDRNRYEKHLDKQIGNLKLEKITPLLLEQLRVRYLRSGLKPQTVCHILGLVRRIYNYLIQLNLYSGTNPASKISLPREDSSRHRFLTKEEAITLLFSLKVRSVQVWQMSLLSLSTGMRAGEVFNLRGEHIDLINKTIRVVDPKNNKNRTVFLTKATEAMLKELHLKRGHLLFKSTKGKQITAISDTFSRVVQDLGLNSELNDSRDKIVFHSLRHTFASWLVQNDQPLYVVAELLGHSSLEMTKRYAHLSLQRRQAATTVLNSLL